MNFTKIFTIFVSSILIHMACLNLSETTMLQWNCRSFKAKVFEAKHSFVSAGIPLICLNETRVKNCPRLTNYVGFPSNGTPINAITYVRRDISAIQINCDVKIKELETMSS